jgi:tetratricopeptide (TPR) repeat protein
LKLLQEEPSMHRKNFFIFLAAVAALLLTGVTASAQLDRLRGQITLQQADGTAVPVEKAVVEVFRLDRGGNKDTTTDKKGNFTLVLDVAGDYVVAISAPNAAPQVMPIKVREEIYKIALTPGDGRRFTKDEVLAAVRGSAIPSNSPAATPTATTTASTTPAAPTESADDKAKRAEIERKNEEIKAKNAKVEQSNAIVIRTYKAGNEALKAERFDEAITQYDEGLAADPEQPALLTNKAFALTRRGVVRYNAAKNDEAARAAAKKDFTDATEAAKKAYDLVKAETPGADAAAQQRQTLSKNLAIFARAEAMRLFVTKVDQSQIDAAVTAYDEYIAILTDPAKKLESQIMAAKMQLDAGKPDGAATAYQKILETSPDNVDALRGVGVALFSTGDKAKYQEAANYLQKFVDKAPDTHPDKKDVQAILAEMKKENVTPQKSAGGRRRG